MSPSKQDLRFFKSVESSKKASRYIRWCRKHGLLEALAIAEYPTLPRSLNRSAIKSEHTMELLDALDELHQARPWFFMLEIRQWMIKHEIRLNPEHQAQYIDTCPIRKAIWPCIKKEMFKINGCSTSNSSIHPRDAFENELEGLVLDPPAIARLYEDNAIYAHWMIGHVCDVDELMDYIHRTGLNRIQQDLMHLCDWIFRQRYSLYTSRPRRGQYPSIVGPLTKRLDVSHPRSRFSPQAIVCCLDTLGKYESTQPTTEGPTPSFLFQWLILGTTDKYPLDSDLVMHLHRDNMIQSPSDQYAYFQSVHQNVNVKFSQNNALDIFL